MSLLTAFLDPRQKNQILKLIEYISPEDGSCLVGRQVIVGLIQIEKKSGAQLAQIIHTVGRTCLIPRLAQGRQQHRSQNSYDRYNDGIDYLIFAL